MGEVSTAIQAAADYVRVVSGIHEVYRHLVMDTAEDKAIHARHIDVADKALDLAARRLTELGAEVRRIAAAEPDPQGAREGADDG